MKAESSFLSFSVYMISFVDILAKDIGHKEFNVFLLKLGINNIHPPKEEGILDICFLCELGNIWIGSE